MIDINFLIYAYLFVCITLLLYNLMYMMRANHNKKKQKRLTQKWKQDVETQCLRLTKKDDVETVHLHRLETKLKKQGELLAYFEAIESLDKHKGFSMYLTKVHTVQQSLAYAYAKKDNMNRAFFAYVISCYPSVSTDEFSIIMEILLSYLNDSTVYCRENVLHALYALGNVKAVESALQIFHDRGYFHHQKLLADGLASFQGDREKLLTQLWMHHNEWNENIILSIVQCINLCSNQYTETFLPILSNKDVNLDVRLAMIRYYHRHVYEPVKEILYSFFDDDTLDENLLVVSAFVLDQYPCNKTIVVLKKAICHHNWYVRQNAAHALVNLHVDVSSLEEIWEGNDRYAKEMLRYVSGKGQVSKHE